MPDFDLILRAGKVVLEDRMECLDLGIAEGRIAGLASNLPGTAAAELDCTQWHVFPGVIDSHVHFNEPGRTDWEGIATGSRAVAAGGGVCYFDMPLNSSPPVLDRASFAAKRAAAEASSVVDFGLWGGLTPTNLDRLEELREAGVVGLKAFMCPSGIDDFLAADEGTLTKGMTKAAELGLLVAVHAESPKSLIPQQPGRTSIRDFLDSRPVTAEFEAIRLACDIAGETRCRLHIVHVSSAEGVELIADKRAEGVDVTCETCPHYLVLSEEDTLQLGAVAKCAPPLRTPAMRDALRQTILQGHIQTLGSDHSPSPPEMKQAKDFFAAWGGIAGAQHLFPLLLDLWTREQFPDLLLLSRCLSRNVAERFRLPDSYGRIAFGAEANLALVDLDGTEEITAQRLHYRHALSPYAGRVLQGQIKRTLLRGKIVAENAQATGVQAGRLIVPHRK